MSNARTPVPGLWYFVVGWTPTGGWDVVGRAPSRQGAVPIRNAWTDARPGSRTKIVRGRNQAEAYAPPLCDGCRHLLSVPGWPWTPPWEKE